MNKDSFAQLYKTWPTDQLLDIINNPGDYQPVALEAARMELDSRQLSGSEMESAAAIQAGRQQEKADRQQKVASIKQNFQSAGTAIAEALRPIEQTTPTADRTIKYLALLLGGLALWELYSDFRFLAAMFTDASAEWDLSVSLHFLPLFVFPCAALLLWFRKKGGWVLATGFFSMSAISVLMTLKLAIWSRVIHTQLYDSFFSPPSPQRFIVPLIIHIGAIWFLSKANIRSVFHISKPVMFLTIGVGVLLFVLVSLASM
ncbi:hypothetical protein WJU16_04615 [Chitinophaga pollutisoli]|uniref:Yip1 domain-containing protein n=1 Tax=Chitinophaga pollutisoli TaxID=3133966 RepID=A0ABZ2YS62_9BACT